MKMYLAYKLDITVGQASEFRRLKLHKGMLKITAFSIVYYVWVLVSMYSCKDPSLTLFPWGKHKWSRVDTRNLSELDLQRGREFSGPPVKHWCRVSLQSSQLLSLLCFLSPPSKEPWNCTLLSEELPCDMSQKYQNTFYALKIGHILNMETGHI